ncbi:nicotinate-nucleotide--dimethylbenzimidazole phosphoribosyltransferase [Chengkuizengella axinellae]|uniref:Nicotinate-nucleotide--dimethylbenzimidazole phosphoribosyltransferase n=1 Tax=Chengkuizengella axinellae TaxID=3064388 RepID=A0ABT9J0U4_9BACL|nr:nicotinate-nucleotide--dimethylbenzimidazole phosphoribosyltransferase [Chengkuizengella sp. 2205SS18-9]MDP5275213.1 nicotinate-nucleotide--dimethylbenzimidazole phosphoribosyltransferase [Chengkuizengella sp. 2205SS18-9]
MHQLNQVIQEIKPLNENAILKTLNHLNQLTKPPGSLGRLEDLAKQISGISHETVPDLSKKAVVVMAADHGVCEEGISAFPQEVTPQMVYNFLNSGAAINVLARQANAEVFCVDIGVKGKLDHPNLIQKKVKPGTDNMAKQAAMSIDEALQAVLVGVEVVEELVEKGYKVVATGEMGIGNTTASAAILTALTSLEIEHAVGRGTGINDEMWKHKQNVVKSALEINQPNPKNALDVLAKVGGLEIAGLVGVILGAAKARIPVVIDGFISSAAALVAYKLCSTSVQFMIPSHLSQEHGHQFMLQEMGLTPMLHLDMRLGEGTGAALCFQLIDASLNIMSEMATFESAGVSGATEEEVE